MVRDEAARTMLFELDTSIQGLRKQIGDTRGGRQPDRALSQPCPPLGGCMRIIMTFANFRHTLVHRPYVGRV